MSHRLTLLDQLVKAYKMWSFQLSQLEGKTKNIILQIDAGNSIEEKVVSIVFSFVVMFILKAIVLLFVASINILLSIVFFIVGFALSKIFNKKYFGKPRRENELSEEERVLLEQFKTVCLQYTTRAKEIEKKVIYFENYPRIAREFDAFVQGFISYSFPKLAWKYKAKIEIEKVKLKQYRKKLHAIYAHKGEI